MYSPNRFAHFKILRKQRYYRYWNGYLGFTRVHGETRYNEAKNAEIAAREMKEGYIFKYTYIDKNDEFLFSVKLTPDDYQ